MWVCELAQSFHGLSNKFKMGNFDTKNKPLYSLYGIVACPYSPTHFDDV